MSIVYILESETDNAYYIGYTKDLERRLDEHQSDKGGWTSGRGPWTLKYFEEYEDDTEARKREIKLKKARNKTYLAWLVANGPGTSIE